MGPPVRAMESTPDPNADLVGHVFLVEMPGHGLVEGTVLGSWPLGSLYVELETAHGRTVRVAAQARRSKELNA